MCIQRWVEKFTDLEMKRLVPSRMKRLGGVGGIEELIIQGGRKRERERCEVDSPF